MKLGISYGLLSDPLKDQINKYGFDYGEKEVEMFQRQIDAINELRFGILTDSQSHKLVEKLHKKIVRHICKKNNMPI